jgi:hypothetical protein
MKSSQKEREKIILTGSTYTDIHQGDENEELQEEQLFPFYIPEIHDQSERKLSATIALGTG